MYEHYRLDQNEYLQLEEYIYSQFFSLRNEMDWEAPYYTTHFSNGVPFFDANPIFSALNIKANYIIKIILDEDIEDFTEFEDIIEGSVVYSYVFNIKDLHRQLKRILNRHLL